MSDEDDLWYIREGQNVKPFLVVDELLLTAGAFRAMGHFVPSDIPDDVRCRMTKRLDADSETLHVTIEAYPDGYLDAIECTVRVT